MRIWGSLDPFIQEGEIMGRGVANAQFLDFLLRRDPFDAYHFFLADEAARTSLERWLQAAHAKAWAQGRFLLAPRTALPEALARQDYAVFHLSDCINYPAHLARTRNALARDLFPITSVTHSLSYARYGAHFLAQLWGGWTRRDAVVATSRSGRAVVQAFHAYLMENYGLDPERFAPPAVERIPLGVDPGALAPPGPEERSSLRARLGLGPDKVVFLCFARLSHHSKMDLLPVLRACRRLLAGGVGADRFVLVAAGWTSPGDDYPAAMQDAARNLGLDFRLVPRPDEELKRALFGAADVFLSPVDNLQETFGLTVLEAGAMGLPVLASDFDGYRDLVEHGRTGLLIPTLGPSDTSDTDHLAHVLFDNQHHLRQAQQTVVDVGSLARAMAHCVEDPDEMRAMGAAARNKVAAEFAWDRIIDAWLELWGRLAAEPVADREALRGLAHPMHPPYGRVFGGYATRTLDPDLAVRWTTAGEAVYRERDFLIVYGGLESDIREEAVKRLLFLARKPVAVAELVRRAGESASLEPGAAVRHILWSLKHDLLEPAEPDPEA